MHFTPINIGRKKNFNFFSRVPKSTDFRLESLGGKREEVGEKAEIRKQIAARGEEGGARRRPSGSLGPTTRPTVTSPVGRVARPARPQSSKLSKPPNLPNLLMDVLWLSCPQISYNHFCAAERRFRAFRGSKTLRTGDASPAAKPSPATFQTYAAERFARPYYPPLSAFSFLSSRSHLFAPSFPQLAPSFLQ